MLKFQLKSGKIAEMNLSPIETALTLYRSVIYECKGAGLDLSIADEATVGDLILKNTEALLNILGSTLVMDAIKDCCDKVLYNKQRFSMEIFEDEKTRGDFFPLMYLVALENLRPFFPEAHIIFNVIELQFLKN